MKGLESGDYTVASTASLYKNQSWKDFKRQSEGIQCIQMLLLSLILAEFMLFVAYSIRGESRRRSCIVAGVHWYSYSVCMSTNGTTQGLSV